MHTTTTTPAPALPGGRKPPRARNAAIAALGVVCAAIVAAGVTLGGKPAPSHAPTAPAASTPASPAHLHEHNAMTKRRQVTETPSYQLHGRPVTGPVPDVPAEIAGLAAPA